MELGSGDCNWRPDALHVSSDQRKEAGAGLRPGGAGQPAPWQLRCCCPRQHVLQVRHVFYTVHCLCRIVWNVQPLASLPHKCFAARALLAWQTKLCVHSACCNAVATSWLPSTRTSHGVQTRAAMAVAAAELSSGLLWVFPWVFCCLPPSHSLQLQRTGGRRTLQLQQAAPCLAALLIIWLSH